MESNLDKLWKKNSSMTEMKFYAEGKYGVFIDLRSMSDNFHGSGLKLINTKDGVNTVYNDKKSHRRIGKCKVPHFHPF